MICISGENIRGLEARIRKMIFSSTMMLSREERSKKRALKSQHVIKMADNKDNFVPQTEVMT